MNGTGLTRPRSRSRARSLRFPRLALIVALSLAITGSASMPLAVAASVHSGTWLDMAGLAIRYAPVAPVLRALEGGDAISRGKDGRLTVLLLGSDYRKGTGGDRTDTIMVVTINPKTKEAAALSIPRDVANFPLPNGTIYKSKINTLLKSYRRQSGLSGAASINWALPRVSAAIAHILKVEIDYYAMIRFNGVETLVDHVNGVTVRIDNAWFDPKHPKGDPPGSYFPASTSWMLRGTSAPQCRGWYALGPYKGQAGYYCQRALVYARSRKGKGNNDFVRAGRQQRLVEAAVKKVLSRGKGSSLTALLSAGKGQVDARQVWTSIPLTTANAVELYDVLNGFRLTRTVVLKPTTYARKIPGTSKYELKLDAVRSLTKVWFAPVK